VLVVAVNYCRHRTPMKAEGRKQKAEG